MTGSLETTTLEQVHRGNWAAAIAQEITSTGGNPARHDVFATDHECAQLMALRHQHVDGVIDAQLSTLPRLTRCNKHPWGLLDKLDAETPTRNGKRDVPEVRETKKEHMTVRLKKEGDSHGRLVFPLRGNDIRTDSEN